MGPDVHHRFAGSFDSSASPVRVCDDERVAGGPVVGNSLGVSDEVNSRKVRVCWAAEAVPDRHSVRKAAERVHGRQDPMPRGRALAAFVAAAGEEVIEPLP